MKDLYEAQIKCFDDEHNLYVDHRFAAQPSIETVKALRDEALSWYEELYEVAPENVSIALVRLDAEEEVLTPSAAPVV